MLRGKRYNAVKADQYSHPKESVYHFDTRPTRDKISQQFGVSPATIQRDGNFAKAAERAAEMLNSACR
jgi:hypothetical protein